MKSVMSGLDLRAIASGLETMVDSHCKKCYQPHYEQVVLRLRAKDGGNTDLVLLEEKESTLDSVIGQCRNILPLCNGSKEGANKCKIEGY